MLRKISTRISQGALLLCALLSTQLYAGTPIKWISTSDQTLNNPSNWDADQIPMAGDDAVFDSTIGGIVTNPYEFISSQFNPDNINFLHSAEDFSLLFQETLLQLNDVGITGAQTNTTLEFLSGGIPSSSLPLQMVFSSGGNNSIGSAKISLTNSAELDTGSGATTGIIEFVQLGTNSSSTFSILPGGSISATNQGTDDTTNVAGNTIANVGEAQIMIYNLNAGGQTAITVTNQGTNNNQGGTSSSHIGIVSGSQILIQNITAGDNFTLKATNSGTDNSSSTVNNEVGKIGINQIEIDQTCNLGNHVSFTVLNSGASTGTASGPIGLVNQVGIAFNEQVQAGDYLTLSAMNTGSDTGSGPGMSSIGTVVDQIFIDAPFNTGNYASITVCNSGTNHNPNANINQVGRIYGSQILSSAPFSAGDYLNINATNMGEDTSTVTGDNNVGRIDSVQIGFEDICNIGDNAIIKASNSGTGENNSNFTGYANVQFYTDAPLTAGKNLALTVTNTGSSTNNKAGFATFQIFCNDTFTIDNGSVISASNSGTVGQSQMLFQQGFTVTSGRATIQAINQGSLGNYGIIILADTNTGGNAIIDLENSSMRIASTPSTFNIGGLTGSSSTVQSTPKLYINTDADVNVNFAGTIQDDFANPTLLVKTGPGIQQLSGTNTLTGPVDIQGGTLNLTGSLTTSDVNIDAGGILMGTGSVGGNVFNSGAIAPGESIGTIRFLQNFTNTNGNYDLEVDGSGHSDFISVTQDTMLNGGYVVVSSVDGLYEFQTPYHILHANSVTGTFTGGKGFSPLLDPRLIYYPQDIYVTLYTSLVNGAETHNQYEVATQLDGIINPNAQQTLLLSQLVNLPLDDARDALDSLSGYQHTTDAFTSAVINRQFIRRLYDPLRSIVTIEPCCTCCDPCNFCCNSYRTWLEVEGSYLRSTGNDNAHGFNMNGFEVTAGMQTSLCNDFTFGVAGSYENDKLRYKQGGGTDNVNSWFAGFYGLYRPSCYYGLLDLAYGHSCHKLKRSINVGILHYDAHSRPKTCQYTVYGEVGLDWDCSCWLIQPFVGIEGAWFHRNSICESYANGWGLNVYKRTSSFATARFGIHATTSPDQCYDLSLDIAWNQRLSKQKNKVREGFQQFGTNFDIYGLDITNYSIDYALTVSRPIFDLCNVYLETSGEIWHHAYELNILAGVEYCW